MHSLNIKITYNCINKCKFCFSSYPKDISISSKDIIKAINKGWDNGCRALVITGGEPTLYPDKVIKYLEYAYKIGYKNYTIQTNGYGLSNKGTLHDFLKDFSKNNYIALSFSIHGSSKLIHYHMTLNKNSFDNLIKAIENSSQTNCRLFSNSIISHLNIDDLYNIYMLLDKYSFEIMQFAVMHTLQNLYYSVGLIKSSYAIHNLCNKLKNISKLRTEGIPYCLLYGLEKCVGESYWPNKLDIFNSRNDYINDFDQLTFGLRKKAFFCHNCIMDSICSGVWSEHIDELYTNCHPIC